MTRAIAAFVLLVSGLAPEPSWAARLIASPHGETAWLLDNKGAISRVDLREPVAAPWNGAGGSNEPRAVSDIALSSDGATLYTLTPAPDGRTTQVLALDTASGQERGRWDVRGQGRFLVVTSDGARACIVGTKAASAGRRAGKSAILDDDWIVIILDLASGSQTPPMSPGLTPLAVTLMEAPGDAPKVLLSAAERVATFSVEPLRASWFYKSPGENNDVAVSPGSAVVCLLRGSSLAVIDPARRPKEGGRVQLGEDDATSVVALPARGRALSISGDGRLAAVLHDDGAATTVVDLVDGTVLSTDELDVPRDLIARRLIEGGGENKLTLVLASSSEPGGSLATREIYAPIWVDEPDAQSPPRVVAGLAAATPSAPAAAAEPVPEKAPAEPATNEKKDEELEPKAKPSEPPPGDTAPRDQPPPATSPPAATPPATTPPAEQPPPSSSAAVPAPELPPAPTPIAPPREAAGDVLKGRVTGEFTQAQEVLFFGPGNILKLHSRAKVEPDGTFSLPLPPPGSYRVVVSAGPGVHIFTHPEFRSVTVTEGAGGLEGIDFEVRGAIK